MDITLWLLYIVKYSLSCVQDILYVNVFSYCKYACVTYSNTIFLVFLENISKLVDSLRKKLGLVPPHKERSDTAKPYVVHYYLKALHYIYLHHSVPARSRGATISHARTGM